MLMRGDPGGTEDSSGGWIGELAETASLARRFGAIIHSAARSLRFVIADEGDRSALTVGR